MRGKATRLRNPDILRRNKLALPAMASKSDAAWPLLGPLGVADDAEEACHDKAAANTSIGREVEFWLEYTKPVWLLHTNNLDTPDPYGGEPIRSFTEVICAHDGLVLLRLHTQHRNFPTDYFVYDRNTREASLLPEMEPAIHSTSSMGLLRRDDDGYVAANLRQELDPETAKLETFLHRYSPPKRGCGCGGDGEEERWSKIKVKLPFDDEEELWGWQTHRVIPFQGTLLWVDLSRGILWSSQLHPSRSEEDSIEFYYVPLPADLLSQDNTTCDRPEPLRTVGCCNGEVKLVNLTHDRDAGAGRASIWTLNWSEKTPVWQGGLNMDLAYTKIRSEMKAKTTTDSLPCFPVLSTDQSDTLYLTLPEESRAWLLRVDLQDGELRDYVEYPSFCDHMNPPYPSDLGNRKPADQCRNETPNVLNASQGHQNTPSIPNCKPF